MSKAQMRTKYQVHRCPDVIRLLDQSCFLHELLLRHDQRIRCLRYHTKLEYDVPTKVDARYTSLVRRSSTRSTCFRIVLVRIGSRRLLLRQWLLSPLDQHLHTIGLLVVAR